MPNGLTQNPLSIDLGGTGAATAAAARTALGVQALDATLTALAGVTVAADKVIYATGADAFSTADLTSFGRSITALADAAAARTLFGLATIASSGSASDLSAGTVAVARGGTGTGSAFTQNNVVYAGASGVYTSSANLTFSGSVLQVKGSIGLNCSAAPGSLCDLVVGTDYCLVVRAVDGGNYGNIGVNAGGTYLYLGFLNAVGTLGCKIDSLGNLTVATALKINATKVIGEQGAAIADAAGGVAIDIEARAAINAMLARMRAHGLIAT